MHTPEHDTHKHWDAERRRLPKPLEARMVSAQEQFLDRYLLIAIIIMTWVAVFPGNPPL